MLTVPPRPIRVSSPAMRTPGSQGPRSADVTRQGQYVCAVTEPQRSGALTELARGCFHDVQQLYWQAQNRPTRL